MGVKIGRPPRPVADRFWEKVNRRGPRVGRLGRCWLYTGAPDNRGYGQFWCDGRNDRAHRVAWILTYGPIPEGVGYHGMCVLHRCDTPLCVRPTHLFLGTVLDNITDMDSKDRRVTGARQLGEDHPGSKLTEDDVRAIRQGYSGTWGEQSALARRYQVTQPTVRAVLVGKTWRHVA